MLTVVGRTPRVGVLPVSMVMDLIATKIVVCVAMVYCICLVQALHERRLDNSCTDVPASFSGIRRDLARLPARAGLWASRSPPSEGARRKFRPSMATDQT